MAQPVFNLGGREYPLPDFSTITFKEARLVKQATGLRMGELAEAFQAGDTDAILALFLVSKMRTDGDVKLSEVEKLPVQDLSIIQPEDDEEVPLEDSAEAKEEIQTVS